MTLPSDVYSKDKFRPFPSTVRTIKEDNCITVIFNGWELVISPFSKNNDAIYQVVFFKWIKHSKPLGEIKGYWKEAVSERFSRPHQQNAEDWIKQIIDQQIDPELQETLKIIADAYLELTMK